MHRNYLSLCALLTGGALLALAGFNLVVDGYRAYRVVDVEALGEVKLESANRIGKAEMIRHGRFDVILLGTSRTAVGIDPGHPAWGSDRVANLGLAGPTAFELASAFRYATARGGVTRAVLFADFITFKDALATEGDYAQSRFNPDRSALDYHFENLLSLRATRHSIGAIAGHLEGTDRVVGETGFIRHVDLERMSPAERFDRVLRSSLIYNYQGVYAPASIARVEEMVEGARSNGIELTIVIPPVHALQLEAIHHLGLWDDFERWKRDLLAVTQRDRERHPDRAPIALWDFTGYTPFSTERVPPDGGGEMDWWIDSSHFSTRLGDLVVSRIAGEDDPRAGDDGARLGVLLTPRNVDAVEARTRRDREAWVRTHPAEMELFEGAARRVDRYLENRRRRFGRG